MSGERISLVPFAHSTLSNTIQQGPKLQLHLSQQRLADHRNCWEVNCLNEQTEWQASLLMNFITIFNSRFIFIFNTMKTCRKMSNLFVKKYYKLKYIYYFRETFWDYSMLINKLFSHWIKNRELIKTRYFYGWRIGHPLRMPLLHVPYGKFNFITEKLRHAEEQLHGEGNNTVFFTQIYFF